MTMKRPWLRNKAVFPRHERIVRWLIVVLFVFCRVYRIQVEGFECSHQVHLGQILYSGRPRHTTCPSLLSAVHVDGGEDAVFRIHRTDDPNDAGLAVINDSINGDINGSSSQEAHSGLSSSARESNGKINGGVASNMFFRSQGHPLTNSPGRDQSKHRLNGFGKQNGEVMANIVEKGESEDGSLSPGDLDDIADDDLDIIVEAISGETRSKHDRNNWEDANTEAIEDCSSDDLVTEFSTNKHLVSDRQAEFVTNETNQNAVDIASRKNSTEIKQAKMVREAHSSPQNRLGKALPSLKRTVVSRVSGFFSQDDSRKLWRRRHARSLEEGIRREKSKNWRKELSELKSLLRRTQFDTQRVQVGRRFLERTIMGLINALAEEVEDLDVTLDSISGTPIWRKEVKEVRVNFSRLGMKPLRMGGCEVANQVGSTTSVRRELIDEEDLSLIECADEAFDRIDIDNSGALDSGEIAKALARVSDHDSDGKAMEALATELVELYDSNGDGVVDREEYQRMVEDMAALQKARLDDSDVDNGKNVGPLSGFKKSVQTFSQDIRNKAVEVADGPWSPLSNKNRNDDIKPKIEKTFGSIILSDVKLDLRRLVFGGFPLVKTITPGGPLVLEPFTMTLKGSFNREDVMGSFLLDAGLRLLVARALRVRVRSFRDFVDGAMFFGRRWKMSSKSAPVVEVLGLSNVEFDEKDRMILTGRARIRASPEAPVVTNTFKVRTKIGTRKGGQAIRLVEPELAFVFECPEAWEKGIRVVYEKMKLPVPERPAPVYSFFPIYSPFKVNDNAGFDMGEDNRLRSIFIKDGALQFEMRAVLRPGRFLGNHYLAFTLPNRTFIITMDRLKEGIRAARRNKKVALREKKLEAQRKLQAQKAPNPDFDNGEFNESNRVSNFASLDELRCRLLSLRGSKKNRTQPKSFFSRFVEGYTLVERDGEAENERLTMAISAWFGRQGSSNSTELSD